MKICLKSWNLIEYLQKSLKNLMLKTYLELNRRSVKKIIANRIIVIVRWVSLNMITVNVISWLIWSVFQRPFKAVEQSIVLIVCSVNVFNSLIVITLSLAQSDRIKRPLPYNFFFKSSVAGRPIFAFDFIEHKNN